MSGQRPNHEIKLGRIRASIWTNNGEHGPTYSTKFSKLFKDDAGQWKDTDSFSRDDLLLLAKAADQAHSLILEQQALARSDSVE